MLKRLGIRAVINCAPAVCADPVDKYKECGITYLALDAHDDRNFPLLKECLPPATAFIEAAHADGRAVLVHCMAGVNRSATLAVAYLLMRDKQCLFTLFQQCVAARPAILQNPSFQLQLCSLAQRNGLLYECGEPEAPPAEHPHAPPSKTPAAPPPAAAPAAGGPGGGGGGTRLPSPAPGGGAE